MAINLASGSNGRVDWGDIAAFSGATAISWAYTIKPTTTLNDRRLWSQWGGAAGNQAWIFGITGATGKVDLVISNGGGTYHQKVSPFVIANGVQTRHVWTLAFGSPPVFRMWADGVEQTLTDGFATGNVNACIDSLTFVQLGHETDEGIDGLDGDHSEVAIWLRVLAAAEAAAISRGWSPRLYHRNRLLYASLRTTDARDTRDIWGNRTGTLTGGTTAAHGNSLFYPTSAKMLSIPATPPVVEFEFEGSGGLAFGGAATLDGLGLGGIVGSGGIAFGGTDETDRSTIVGSGGIAFGGTVADQFATVGSGGMAFGGHARGGKGGPATKVDCGPTLLGEECDAT